jgi:hypothetical protein
MTGFARLSHGGSGSRRLVPTMIAKPVTMVARNARDQLLPGVPGRFGRTRVRIDHP